MCNALRQRRIAGQIHEETEAWETGPHMLITMLELGAHEAGKAFENRAAAIRWHPDKSLWTTEEEKRLATKVFQLHRCVFDRQRSELASTYGNASVRVPTAQQRRAKAPVFSPRTMYRTPEKQSRADLRSTR